MSNEQQESIKSLIQYVDHATSRGAYTLTIAKEILETLGVFEDISVEDKTDAFQKLIGYVDHAFRRGSYSLADAQAIVALLEPFAQREEPRPRPQVATQTILEPIQEELPVSKQTKTSSRKKSSAVVEESIVTI